MISPIGSSCFKSDLDCDQILHIQWDHFFLLLPVVLLMEKLADSYFVFRQIEFGTILQSCRHFDKSNTWVVYLPIRIFEFFSKNNKLPRLYDVSNIHHSLEEAFSFPFMHFSIMQIGMWIFMRIKVTSSIAMPTYEKNEQFTY